jgi:hypothetical protein
MISAATSAIIDFKNIAVLDGPAPFSIIKGFDAEHTVQGVTIEV